MTHSLSRLRRGTIAAVTAILLAMVGLIGVGSAANAAPSFGNINENASGVIHIHKHETQTSTGAVASPDGSESIPSDGVAGVTFTAYEIVDGDGNLVDLTVPGNWDDLSGLSVSADGSTLNGAPAGWTIGDVAGVSGATNADGEASINIDSIGAYVVVETDAPANVIQTALPFIVTIPFPHGDGWLYDVHVYPKNGLTDVSKTIEAQEGLGLGSVVSFPVTTNLPGLEPGLDFTSFVIQDTLDNRLGNLEVASVQVNGTDVPSGHYDVVANGQTLRVVFNVGSADTQAWLRANGGEQIVTTFQGTVESIANGVITNEATVFVNDPNEDNGITSDEVRTNWGDIKIRKIDSSDTSATLDGAEFEVYAIDDAYTQPTDLEAAIAGATPLTVGGSSVFTSVDGIVTIPGLFVSDSENAPINAQSRWYIVKEIQAPAGFVTPEGAAALRAVNVQIGVTAEQDITVENVQQDVPELPLTGAAGQILMIIGGIALLLIAAGLVMMKRRQATAQQ
ncbi:SpaH/EbpB family LPXTG-anchored major pilin [Citricoccus muralis]|uniref:SpaH/EbpB family LPXTG-anchored major pilin n=1 Tax=Citricoccus muralis TaxID=169134 RepID=A0ABY8H490_9MICC|nr:SpaH/EbpB family LPXTG-anchored major pilin [Citricoccus muralis]WFP15951.1 SpaH/EbpB family LPXTG-anchored major pilin [Citricoccus muralis]